MRRPAYALRRVAAVFLSFLVVMGMARTARPRYNWDMLMYNGIAELMRGASLRAAHDYAYFDGRYWAGADAFQRTPYELTVARDLEAYRQQLPFYTIKPAYPALIALLRTRNASATEAGLLISRVAVALLAGLSAVWLLRWYKPLPAAVLAILVVSTPYVFDLARYSTPDALSVLAVLGSWLLLAHTGRLGAGPMLLLLLSILIRPDNVLLACLSAGFFFLTDPAQRGRATFLAVIALGAYAGIGHLAGNYGWSTLFNQSLLGPNPYPATQPVHLALGSFAHGYLRQAHPQSSGGFILFELCALLALLLWTAGTRPRDLIGRLLAVNAAALGLHWLLYPTSEDRVRAAYYLIPVLMIVAALASLPKKLLPLRIRELVFSTAAPMPAAPERAAGESGAPVVRV